MNLKVQCFRPLSGIKPHQFSKTTTRRLRNGISVSDPSRGLSLINRYRCNRLYPGGFGHVSDPSRGLSLINSIDIYILLQQEHAVARSSKTNRLQLNKQIDTTISSFFNEFTKNHRTTSTCQFIHSYFILRVKIFF